MICIDVSLNGERVSRAGFGDFGFISATIGYAVKDGSVSGELSISGMEFVSGTQTNDHLVWTPQTVGAQDVVTLSISDAERADSHKRTPEVPTHATLLRKSLTLIRRAIAELELRSDADSARLRNELKLIIAELVPTEPSGDAPESVEK